jgi:hypothetical protein
LEALGARAAIPFATGPDRTPAVLFWNGEFQAAMAYLPTLNGEPLTFEAGLDGIVDRETGSRWRVDGRAQSGPLAGARLEPVRNALVAYWWAWNAFFPETTVWGPGKPGSS